jgi:membrane-bound ClpP family serine protease
MDPNTAFCLLVSGVLGVYVELLWPGLVWPGVTGLGAVITASYFLLLAAPASLGLGLLAAAVFLFVLDLFVETLSLAGAAATVALALGFTQLGPPRIQPLLALPGCLGLGTLTLVLNRAMRRARWNKRADLLWRE